MASVRDIVISVIELGFPFVILYDDYEDVKDIIENAGYAVDDDPPSGGYLCSPPDLLLFEPQGKEC